MINEELNINMDGLNLDSLTTDLNSSIDVDLNIMADDEANLDIENLDIGEETNIEETNIEETNIKETNIEETNIEETNNKYQEMSVKDLQNKIKELSEIKDIKIPLSGNKTKLIQRIIENE